MFFEIQTGRKKLLHWGYGNENGERNFRMISGVRSLYHTIAVPCGHAVLDGPYDNMRRNRKTCMTLTCEDGRIRMALTITLKQPKRKIDSGKTL